MDKQLCIVIATQMTEGEYADDGTTFWIVQSKDQAIKSAKRWLKGKPQKDCLEVEIFKAANGFKRTWEGQINRKPIWQHQGSSLA